MPLWFYPTKGGRGKKNTRKHKPQANIQVNKTVAYCSKGCKGSHQGAVVLKEGVGEGRTYLRQDGQGRPPWSRHLQA